MSGAKVVFIFVAAMTATLLLIGVTGAPLWQGLVRELGKGK
jgi:hypothetical protein